LRDILISGYYGFKNSGDDALLLAIIRDLKKYKEDVSLAVLSNSPKETSEIYKVKAVNRMNPFSIIINLLKSRLLISGGGTLIQDGTSTKSLIYYLGIIKLAHFLGKKVMLYANGIGPLREEHRKMTADILNKVDMITLRDENSLEELKNLGVDKPKIILTADPAFNLECKNSERGKEILKKYGIKPEDKTVLISVRNWKKISPDFCGEIAKTADYLAETYGYKIVFLPMQYSKDCEISENVQKLMKNESVCLEEYLSIDDVLSVIKDSELCIGMRLHSLIYSAGNAVPVIGLVYDVKIAGFMDYINQKYYTDAQKVKFEDLKKMSDECINNREKICSDIIKDGVVLKQKAQSNAKYAIELLNKKERGKALK